ncbi:MAG: endonuclease/exonuclease/phosphatase family protein [Thermoanaerobaculales bacterium]|jgi:predicted extracellular nuclease|nr:endonuclease/exonuclease/phosphatase family protein [Thermoanaerobaculales bacterium]
MTSRPILRITFVLVTMLVAVGPAFAADHLLISEVVVTPTGGEYVEIFNPTDAAIDLTDVYLTDATFAGDGTYYYNIVTGANAGGGGFGDFHARFPTGASIAPAEYQTVAITGSGAFLTEYGAEPTYELFEDGGSPDAIPDMLEALPGAINAQGALSNSGEVVVLYRWDGASDLVQDLDYVLWGDKAEAVDKTGVSLDGPDAGGDTSSFLPDTAIATQDVTMTGAHAIGNSFTRTDREEGAETATGGNGLTGHDETSENLSATFAEIAATPNGGGLVDIGVSIDDVSAAEGDGGTTTFTFTISLTNPAPAGGVSYEIDTADGTATVADLDYSAASASQTIAEGASSTTFDVEVIGDTDGEGNEFFLVEITNVTGSGAGLLDGSGLGTILNDDDLSISIVQGSGESSPLEGSEVTVAGVVVTAIGPEGFFVQTPSGLDDGDINTSEGLHVAMTPPVSLAVGDLVDVTGTVEEFYGFTQLIGPHSVVAAGTGTLPPPITFDAFTPSPDPLLPSCAMEYECYEGMLVGASGLVVGPTQTFGTDPTAEFHAIATSGPPPFREIGAEYPGMLGLPHTVPIWDGNPEIFEVDPDKLGQPDVVAKPGDAYTAIGPLGYEYGGYEIWAAAPVTLTPGSPAVVPVRPADSTEMTIASLNCYRLYDDVDDPTTQDEVMPSDVYATRITKLRRYILDVLLAPDVIGLQEVENLTVLNALAADIAAADPSVSYTAQLVSGNNDFGMNVGYLVRDTVQNVLVTQLGFDDILIGWGYKLFDHPPLLLEGTWTGGGAALDVALMTNHTRSLGGVDDPFDDFAREKRFQQAQSIAQKVQDFQTADPHTPLILVGDYNAFQFTDGYVDVIGQIRGEVTPDQTLLWAPPITAPTLTNQIGGMPAEQRYSYVYQGSRQVLDHALTSRSAAPYVVEQQFGRGNTDSPGVLINDDTVPARATDHDGLVLYLDAGSVLFADGFESGDTTRWSNASP